MIKPTRRGSVSTLQDVVHYALRANRKTADESEFAGKSVKQITSAPGATWLGLAREALVAYGYPAERVARLTSAAIVRLAKSEAKSRGWDAYSDSSLCNKCGNPTYGNPAATCPHR